ncbi:hypothetical protein I3842_01G297700 [Carya illinoinensis]|uniref:Uncharacterized protein n=1 Tax=Carya illinoinensis TaxID=32201 RepID=A0A922KCQ4_CARIL|nr:hypothetical protein I3842_01G297700 [Carya illinoinensis]
MHTIRGSGLMTKISLAFRFPPFGFSHLTFRYRIRVRARRLLSTDRIPPLSRSSFSALSPSPPRPRRAYHLQTMMRERGRREKNLNERESLRRERGRIEREGFAERESLMREI